METGDYNLLYNYNFKLDKLVKIKDPYMFYKTIELFAGLDKSEVDKEINDKIKILKYFVENKINNIEEIALMISYYYINKDYLMKKLLVRPGY